MKQALDVAFLAVYEEHEVHCQRTKYKAAKVTLNEIIMPDLIPGVAAVQRQAIATAKDVKVSLKPIRTQITDRRYKLLPVGLS